MQRIKAPGAVYKALVNASPEVNTFGVLNHAPMRMIGSRVMLLECPNLQTQRGSL